MELCIPTEIGHYNFLTQIKFGNDPFLWKGYDRDKNEEVAIKLIFKQDFQDMKTLTEITDEIALLRSVDHPLVAKLREMIQDSKFYYIILDFPREKPLATYITENGPMTDSQAQKFFKQLLDIANSMCSATTKYVFMLTSDTICVNKNGEIDQVFMTISPRLFNKSIHYLSPEVINGRLVGQPSTVWVCGIILYYSLTGKYPFTGDNDEEISKSVLTRPLFVPTNLSTGAIDLIKKILSKNPVTRLPISAIESHQWLSSLMTPHDKIDHSPILPRYATMLVRTNTISSTRAPQPIGVDKSISGVSQRMRLTPRKKTLGPMTIKGERGSMTLHQFGK